MQLHVIEPAEFPDLAVLNSPLNMPSLHDNLTIFPATLSINDTVLSSAAVENENTSSTNVTVPEGCKLVLTNTSCTATGQVRVPVEARGWVWFRWALKIEEIISDIDKRSTSQMILSASMSSSGVTGHQLKCLGLDPPHLTPAANPGTHTTCCSFPIYASILVSVIGGAVLGALIVVVWRKYRPAQFTAPYVLRMGDFVELPAQPDPKYRARLALKGIDAAGMPPHYCTVFPQG
ncbi:hypothetical protein AURDEDRAFT_165609 [Auricularia subglabra TFB-10046 SS5]|nr:hypothetical protein AURDEDRAFT_165609 [Auricularia subglabra TFB-10046 SS5]